MAITPADGKGPLQLKEGITVDAPLELQVRPSVNASGNRFPVWLRVVAAICVTMSLAWAVMIAFMYIERRDSAVAQARAFAGSANQLILATLTGMMITGVANERAVFLDQIRNSDEIKGVKIFRYGGMITQFGPGDASQGKPDANEERAMAGGKPEFAFNDREGYVQAVFPMRNARDFLGKNCTQCHEGPENAVLGAISLRVNLKGMQAELQTFLWQVMLSAAILTLPLLAAIYFVIRRNVSRPLGGEPWQATEVATRIAAGDLSTPIPVAKGDSTSVMAAMAAMQGNLAGIVAGIKESSEVIATGSKQIASGNSDLSSRTEQQASSLEETASSMEELTSTVKQNAENAKQANQLAAGASEIAVRGGEVVSQVVTTMSGINDSSKRIADIIGVIDGIAFQTNILALNAAVEAARAGEQGRGFAVVASEVRNLAQRSAAAAKEIKDLITESVRQVGNGTALVDEAGKTMQEIVVAVKRVTDVMAEIASASREQGVGIEQVNQAVTQMDETTQQNAALVEQAAAAAESMREQAEQLAHAVSVFKLAQVEAQARSAPPPEAARPAARPKLAAVG